MTEILSASQINQAVCHVTPGVSSAEYILLTCADVFRKGYLVCRKVYLITNNPISFAAGSALSLALGQNDTLAQVSRIILGVLSVIKCSEDLHKLRALTKRCRRIFSGKEYILIKGDQYNVGETHYAYKIRMEKIALLITTLGQMAVIFGELMLHMGDAYVAFNEECSTEVFIHSRDLWDELSSDQSYLVQQLQNNEAVNDWMLGRMNTKTSLCTQMLLGLIGIPSKVRRAMPDMRDLSSAASDMVDDIGLSIKSNIQECHTMWQQIKGIDPRINSEGSTKDLERTRWIKSPKRVNIQDCF